MTAEIISGREVAKAIREEISQEAAQLKEKHGITPGLCTVLVGQDPASVSYVTAKGKACQELGMKSFHHELPEQTTQEELLGLIQRLNQDDQVHGILVQLPLPKHINEAEVLYAIDPNKDVDGFHPVNVGRLVIGEEVFPPCTPAGIQELILRSGTPTEGAEVVVVGRSNIVGKPIAIMMLQKKAGANSTVTVCHTRTRDMAFHTRRADILIVAAGKAKAITADMIKPGATVIDVGVNRVGQKPSKKDPSRMVAILEGDVDFEPAKEVAGKITPVPGGVGPMTITMLMRNTLRAAKLRA
ncbi:MAG TPA: bifunctional methylenetetrahydrofolate dehydrogenase/methenyltetrahydrofolate cyclohydrolase FolD [Planctomycetaceae bacterium]|nr:bifunctional methylenetetrahydrofolate dehydrogenase/methenyltetrahydrofolate cyclohydrolase FolD [Planctomycetaceae bacterium]HIQ22253.1 bifunctional methylenetetrahydrofolate dehydrogenase/methenyltetrahydrofolate cyclohydrolase FolD [Planctomycetota bacterium]